MWLISRLRNAPESPSSQPTPATENTSPSGYFGDDVNSFQYQITSVGLQIMIELLKSHQLGNIHGTEYGWKMWALQILNGEANLEQIPRWILGEFEFED